MASWIDNLIYVPSTSSNTPNVKKPEQKPVRSGWIVGETPEEVEDKIRERHNKIFNPPPKK